MIQQNFSKPLWSYFWPPLLFIAVAAVVVLVASMFSFKVPITKQSVQSGIEQLADASFIESSPFDVSQLSGLTVELREGYIFMKVTLEGELYGKESRVAMTATGYPRYIGAGLFSALYEAITGNQTEKRIVYYFSTFAIEPDSFVIAGKPAIEFVIPGGQKVVEDLANTTPGKLVTRVLKAIGKDTSDTARDQWTVGVMRKYEDALIAWFSERVRLKINNKTLYTFGNLPGEQFFASVFGGIEIALKVITLKFYTTAVIVSLAVALFTFFFTAGYWVRQALYAARDRKFHKLSNEAIGVAGKVTDAVVEKLTDN